MVHYIDFGEFIVTLQKQHVHGPSPHTFFEEWMAMQTKGIGVVCIAPNRSVSAK